MGWGLIYGSGQARQMTSSASVVCVARSRTGPDLSRQWPRCVTSISQTPDDVVNNEGTGTSNRSAPRAIFAYCAAARVAKKAGAGNVPFCRCAASP